MNANKEILRERLHVFYKKFYKNELVKGVILIILSFCIVASFLILLESMVYFPVLIKTFIFYLLLVLTLISFFIFLLVPLLRLYRIKEGISDFHLAHLLSVHFPDMKDQLFNILELMEMSNSQNKNDSLIEASINHKTNRIKVFRFNSAIKYRSNLRYFFLLLGIIFVLGLGVLFYPHNIKSASQRLADYRTYYEIPAPFQFLILNQSLTVEKGDDFQLKVRVKGDYIPDNVYLTMSGNHFLMTQETVNIFSYSLKNINMPIIFHLKSQEVHSPSFTLEVLPSPYIRNYSVEVIAPQHTRQKKNVVTNIGDLTIPEGSWVKWIFQTVDVSDIYLLFEEDSSKISSENRRFTFQKQLMQSTDYSINIKNSYFTKEDFLNYHIDVIQDVPPRIKVNSYKDSLVSSSFKYFHGFIEDDYGFSRLQFVYQINEDKDSSITIPINKNIGIQEFFFSFDFSIFKDLTENKITYYFEVFDNDKINGFKSTRSQYFVFHLPNYKDLVAATELSNKEVLSNIREGKSITEDVLNNLKKLKEQVLMDDLSDWERSQMMKDIVQQQKKLEDMLNKLKTNNHKKNNLLNAFSEKDLALLEKQKQIEKLLDDMMSDELKELLEEFEKLAKKFNKTQLNSLVEKIKYKIEDFEKQLDRNLELLKHFEIEQGISLNINELQQLADKQERLAQEVSDASKSEKEKHKEEVSKTENTLNEIKDNWEKIQQKNNDLKHPLEFSNFDNNFDEIEKKLNEAKENNQNNKKKKSSQNLKESATKTRQLASNMQNMLDANMKQQNSVNITMLREILDNLILFSFQQEDLLSEAKGVNHNDPRLITINREQAALKEKFQLVEDSLYALAEQLTSLTKSVYDEVYEINTNLNASLQLFEARSISRARGKQQFVMTSANNLALLLNEVLDNAQRTQGYGQDKGEGGESENQRWGDKPNFSKMKKQQQALKLQMEALIKKMQNSDGKNLGGENRGKELGEMLGKQELFKQELKKLLEREGTHSKEMTRIEEIIRMMEETERDIAYKDITRNTLFRQNKIITQLLESENAEQERDKENKRESQRAQKNLYTRPPDFSTFDKKKQKFNESLLKSTMILTNFYEKKFSEYLKSINNIKNEEK